MSSSVLSCADASGAASRARSRAAARWPAAHGCGSSEPEVQAEPDEAQMPFASSISSKALALDALEAEVDVAGQPRRHGRRSARLCGIFETPVDQLVAHGESPGAAFSSMLAHGVLQGRLPMPDDAGDVLRAGAAAALLRAAVDQIVQIRMPRCAVQHAHALRAVEFVRREATACRCSCASTSICTCADRLHRVGVEQDARAHGRSLPISSIGWMVPISLLAIHDASPGRCPARMASAHLLGARRCRRRGRPAA